VEPWQALIKQGWLAHCTSINNKGGKEAVVRPINCWAIQTKKVRKEIIYEKQF
jgi:hypothetical protein